MTPPYCAAAIAAIAILTFATPASAQKKSNGSSLAAIQLECFKAQGAYLDPATKRYVMQGTELDLPGKTDAVNKCVAEKTGKPATPFLREEYRYQ